MRTCSRMAERERIIQIPNILLSVKDASIAISVSTKMVRLLIASGRLKAVNLGKGEEKGTQACARVMIAFVRLGSEVFHEEVTRPFQVADIDSNVFDFHTAFFEKILCFSHSRAGSS